YLRDLRRRSFGSARGPIEEGQILEIARECGSTLFLSGRIKTGDYVTWRLVDTRSGKSLAARKVDGGDLAVLADQIIAGVLPVLAHESGVADTVDPLGGSFCIESLTSQIEQDVEAYLQKIDDMGGVQLAIERGYIQREIQESAYAYQKEIEGGERLIMGLNAHASEENRGRFRLYTPRPEVEQNQKQNLRRIKQGRNPARVESRLAELRQAVDAGANLMPPLIEAVKEGISLGEISGLLSEAFGTYRENISI
ncbi:MAG: methylmalonyl-CoA mutase family protein, partial [Candidatus Aminicenantaceae bacterium]